MKEGKGGHAEGDLEEEDYDDGEAGGSGNDDGDDLVAGAAVVGEEECRKPFVHTQDPLWISVFFDVTMFYTKYNVFYSTPGQRRRWSCC